MQCTACNALHDVTQRCCRWLLQTQDRVGEREFVLKHEFLAIMLGVRRPTVTVVMGKLQRSGLIASRYGRIRVLKKKQLQAASCECYEVIRGHFRRLGLEG
jgi:CRP-like cAMP-binding protein